MRTILCLVLLTQVSAAQPRRRQVTSGPERNSLLELFTSEGCSSCPPADSWLSANASRLAAQHIIPLALHVDYWNEIGWIDPFSQARFSARQRGIAARGSGRIYTPELVLDGREIDRAELRRIAEPSTPARARVTLEATDAASDTVLVAAHVAADDAVRLFVALYEDGLTVAVRSGENAGRTLHHDFVVRELIGPVAANQIEHELRLAPKWNRRRLGLVAFVEDARTGVVLQAVALPLSP
jgi:hypothetical protein